MSDLKQRNALMKKVKERMEALTTLQKALKLLKEGWVQCSAGFEEDETYCALSAINTAAGRGHDAVPHRSLAEKLIIKEANEGVSVLDRSWSIIAWNDYQGTTKPMVLGVFQRAITKLSDILPIVK